MESKAFILNYLDEDWVSLLHAETANKAKAYFHRCYGHIHGDYIDIRCHRLPGCDGIPFTFENVTNAGFVFEDDLEDDGILKSEHFINDCECSVCKKDGKCL